MVVNIEEYFTSTHACFTDKLRVRCPQQERGAKNSMKRKLKMNSGETVFAATQLFFHLVGAALGKILRMAVCVMKNW